MICPTCQQEGRKSVVYQGTAWTTLMYCAPFYDEEGRCHHHDMNTTTSHYTCSNGHSFEKASGGSCWCGWPTDKA